MEYEAISKDEKLAEMVGIQPLPLEMEQQVQKMNAILDRFDAETEFDRTTVFSALLDRMPNEENQTLDRMIELAEKLLKAALEEQTEE